MSKANPVETQMRQVLLELSMTAGGRTTSYNSRGTSGAPDWALVDDKGRARLGHGDAPALTFAELWDAAADDDARADVLKAARAELDNIRRRVAPTVVAPETREQLEERIVREGAGWDAQDVAVALRTSVSLVRAARRAAGLDAQTGRPQLDGRALTREERNAEALRLAGLGRSAFQIATALGVPRSSIRYVLARARQTRT